MKSFHDFFRAPGGRPWLPMNRDFRRPISVRMGEAGGFRRWVFFPAVLLAICLGAGPRSHAQVAKSADVGGMRLSAGGTVSGYQLGYGDVKILGASAFVDADTRRPQDL